MLEARMKVSDNPFFAVYEEEIELILDEVSEEEGYRRMYTNGASADEDPT